jgi:GxxExxY protein
MDTNKHELLLKNEVFQIMGSAMQVLNTLGLGLFEKPYENALVVEFGLQNIPFLQQPRYEVIYKDIKVGEYIPDLVVYDAIVVDTKTIEVFLFCFSSIVKLGDCYLLRVALP